jgi:hypothetical protein
LQSLNAALHFVVIGVWFSQTVSRLLLKWVELMLSLQAPASSKLDKQIAIFNQASAISSNKQAERILQSHCANCHQNMLN